MINRGDAGAGEGAAALREHALIAELTTVPR